MRAPEHLRLKIARADRHLRESAASITKHKLQLLQGWHVLFSFQRTSNENRRHVTPVGASRRQGSLNPFPCEASAIIPTFRGAASESRKYLGPDREPIGRQRNQLENRELGPAAKKREGAVAPSRSQDRWPADGRVRNSTWRTRGGCEGSGSRWLPGNPDPSRQPGAPRCRRRGSSHENSAR